MIGCRAACPFQTVADGKKRRRKKEHFLWHTKWNFISWQQSDEITDTSERKALCEVQVSTIGSLVMFRDVKSTSSVTNNVDSTKKKSLTIMKTMNALESFVNFHVYIRICILICCVNGIMTTLVTFTFNLWRWQFLRTWEKKIPSLSSSESPFTVSLGVHAWAKFRKSHFSWSPTSAFKYSFFPFRALPVTVSCPISFVRISSNVRKCSKQALILHSKAYSIYFVSSLFSPKTLYIDYFKSSLASLETRFPPIQKCTLK